MLGSLLVYSPLEISVLTKTAIQVWVRSATSHISFFLQCFELLATEEDGGTEESTPRGSGSRPPASSLRGEIVCRVVLICSINIPSRQKLSREHAALRRENGIY